MSEWISVEGETPRGLIVDIWVEVKPHGYHGRLIDCYFDSGIWKDRDGDLDEIFQGSVTHFMVSPTSPNNKAK